MGIANTNSVVFFGSGPVAAASLQLLLKDFQIEAIITKPSTLNSMKLIAPEIPCFEVSNRNELDTLVSEESFSSNLGILIDFGVIVSKSTIESFSKGIVNSHFSMLPEWRGADPISFAILSGQPQTGVSLMLLVEAMDEGPILAQAPYQLNDSVTGSELTDDLVELSHQCLNNIVPLWISDSIEAIPQGDVDISGLHPLSYSRKLTKNDGIIDWTKSAEQINREIRAFDIWPKSRTKLNNLDVVICSSKISNQQLAPGEILIDSKHLYIGCGQNNSLEILSVKPAGKREMPVDAFLAGYRTRLED